MVALISLFSLQVNQVAHPTWHLDLLCLLQRGGRNLCWTGGGTVWGVGFKHMFSCCDGLFLGEPASVLVV
jgi:hypothetical protein